MKTRFGTDSARGKTGGIIIYAEGGRFGVPSSTPQARKVLRIQLDIRSRTVPRGSHGCPTNNSTPACVVAPPTDACTATAPLAP